MGLHRYSPAQKQDLDHQITFEEGPGAETKDPEYQPIIDALFEDAQRVADMIETLDLPLNSEHQPGAKLPCGRENGWPVTLPATFASEERLEVFKERITLAMAWLSANKDMTRISAYSSSYRDYGEPRNNVFNITSEDANGRLAHFLANEDITEQDVIGYTDDEVRGFCYPPGRMGQNPDLRPSISLRMKLDGPPSAHLRMQANGLMREARERRAIRHANNPKLGHP